MSGLLFGMNIAVTALQTYQKAMDVLGNNVANAQNPNYVRQDPQIREFGTVKLGNLIFGMGVSISSIKRIRDEFITSRLRQESALTNQYTVMRDALRQIESVFNEPVEGELNDILNEFWKSWEDLAVNPEDQSVRIAVREQGARVADTLNTLYENIMLVRNGMEEEFRTLSDKINTLSSELASLNPQVARLESEGGGVQANDLRDRRDQVLAELQELVNIQVKEQTDGTVSVYIHSRALVDHSTAFKVKLDPKDTEPVLADIVWELDGEKLNITSGELYGLIQTRDQKIPYYLQQLNELARTLMVEVNTIQGAGFGLDGSTGFNFFTGNTLQTPQTATFTPVFESIVQGISQLASGTTETTFLADLGVTAGTITINGKVVTITAADVAPAGTTLGGLLDRIAQEAAVKAAYNSTTRRIKIRQTGVQNLTIGALADTSNFLNTAVSGLATAATGAFGAHVTVTTTNDAAARIRINSEIESDLNRIAASDDALQVPGNGDNALNVAALKFLKTMVGDPPTQTYEEFYRGLVTTLGLDVEITSIQVENHELQRQQLENRNLEISGVSLDEEAAKMVQYQQVYNAAARYFSVVSEMLDTLVSLGK